MTNHMASLDYRRAATQQASVVGLVIALHDTLIGNLRRAAEAMDRNDIPKRCDELIHGFKVLTQLEAMLDSKNGGVAAVNIRRFYTHVRSQMLAAQFKLLPEILRDQVKIVVEVRQAWEQVDSGSAAAQSFNAGMQPVGAMQMQATMETEVRTSFSCSG
jgi:flagellar protein FliS